MSKAMWSVLHKVVCSLVYCLPVYFQGGISDVAGWRGVYFCAAIIMLMIALPLWKRLPHLNIQPSAMRYPQLLASMLKLLRQEKVLQVRGVLALLMFAAFNIFLERIGTAVKCPAL